MVLTASQVIHLLEQYEIEVWEGYAVSRYTTEDGKPGERLKPICELLTHERVYGWLGY